MGQQASAEELDKVMRTCRSTAGMRAIEGQNAGDPIIVDRLAEVMAGQEARQRFETLWQKRVQEEGDGKHFYFAGRARILDDRIIALLNSMAADEAGQARPLLQVVSLGCGVDTRPWRLDLPGVTRWFDVDQSPVITIKRRLLQESGAALDHRAIGETAKSSHAPDSAAGSALGGAVEKRAAAHGSAAADKASAAGTADAANGQQAENSTGSGSGNGCRFPLKVGAGYVMVAADLSDGSWMGKLEEAGFDAGAPTVWVAEGLLYYLSLEANTALFEAIAKHSPPGSCMLCTVIPAENLHANHNCPETHHFRGLFKTSVDDVVHSGAMAKAGWAKITVSPDLAVVLQQQYGVESYYPYDLEYSNGKPLQEIEHVVEAVRA